MLRVLALAVVTAVSSSLPAAAEDTGPDAGWQPLFPKDGQPEGWVVRHWADVSEPARDNARWEVKDGVLLGGEPRGNWLLSEREYGDFILEYEFKLGPRGNSGCALRAPMDGDPAFDGMELQMADLRYNEQAKDSELTGGLYRAAAPKEQAFKPEAWNRYRIELRGAKVIVDLNGERILDLNLDEQQAEVLRHDGGKAPPLKDRPRKGHLGFQELSRGGDRVMIRHARIKELPPAGE